MLRRDQQLIERAEEIARLLLQAMNNELSAEDRQKLNTWLHQQDQATREFFDEITDRDQLEKDLQTFGAIDVHKALKEVQQQIAAEEIIGQGANPEVVPVVEPEPIPRRRRFKLLFPWTFVLPLLVCVSVVTIYLLTKRKTTIENVPVAQQVVHDVAPGGNKAVLTLADGHQIALDNASNGELARQGSMQVVKLEAGQLAYKPAESKSQGSGQLAYNSISTPRGGQYQVSLPDGSSVWLNAASSLRFPTAFTGKERRVELTGEAYFQISPNKSMPFIVSIAPPRGSNGGGAGTSVPLEVQVLGTEFDAMAYEDEGDIRTTLVKGSVKVITGNTHRILEPGQQARVENTGEAAKDIAVSTVNIEEITAWKDGSFSFESASLELTMRQLARWYDVDVKYEGEKPTERFTANVSRKNNLSDILRVLKLSGYHFDIQGRTIIVKKG